MDLQLLIALAVLAVSVHGVPPTGQPKYVPVFVSSDTLNSLTERNGGLNEKQPNGESGQDSSSPQGQQNGEYDIKKEIQAIFNTPAPVYEQPHDYHDTTHQQSQGQPQYQENQQGIQQQYQQPNQIQQQYQQANQIQQPYQIGQPHPNQQLYQINQQPGQNQQLYQISPQPGQSQQLYQINQQPGQMQQQYPIGQQSGQIQQPYQIQQLGQTQPVLLAQQGLNNPQQIYPNQQILSGQTVQPNQQVNQQPILLSPQPYSPNQLIQQFQPANQQPLLINPQPMGNQQIISTQPGQQILLNQPPNQQALLLQQPQNGQQVILSSNANNPVHYASNPGQIQGQNQGNVYAVVPINNQNSPPNQNLGNSNTYLVPVQQLPNQVYTVNSG